jgi:hypothetical protein
LLSSRENKCTGARATWIRAANTSESRAEAETRECPDAGVPVGESKYFKDLLRQVKSAYLTGQGMTITFHLLVDRAVRAAFEVAGPLSPFR